MSAFDTLEDQLRESTRRRYGRAGRGWGPRRWMGGEEGAGRDSRAVGGHEVVGERTAGGEGVAGAGRDSRAVGGDEVVGERTAGGEGVAGAQRGRRGVSARRVARGSAVARRSRRAAGAVALVAAGVAVFFVARSPAPPDEHEAALPTPAPTWTPVLGDERRGHPSISRSPVPAEQLAAYGVLRRPQNAADRSRAVQRLLARLAPSMLRGVRVDAIRRLDQRGGRTTVLLSVERLRMNPRDPADDIADGLCLLSGSAGGAGMTCASFHDAVTGRMRWPLPPRGLAPDGTTRVTTRVRGGRTVTVSPRENYYDATWVGEGDAAGIARPRFER